MSVLKVYYKIMKSHWLTLMIYMSIFFTVFFVFGMSASERSDIKMYEGSKPNIAVLDRDGSSLSEGLLTYLGTQANIKHKNVSNSDAQDALFYADVSAIITIPEGFEEEFASGKEAVSMNQRPDDVNGVLLQQTINKYLDTMHAYEKLYPKQGISELHTRVQKNLNTTAEVKMSDSEEVATSSMLRGAYFNYASYIMLVITILLIMAVGGIFKSDFGLFYQVPRDSNSLYNVTYTLDVFVYKQLMSSTTGMASAAAFVQSVAGCITILLANAVVRKVDRESAMI